VSPKKLPAYLVAFTFILLFNSCSKPPDLPPVIPTPPVTTTTPTIPPTPTDPIFIVEGKWECQVDGVFYSGTVDTSFSTITGSFNQDTMVYCN